MVLIEPGLARVSATPLSTPLSIELRVNLRVFFWVCFSAQALYFISHLLPYAASTDIGINA